MRHKILESSGRIHLKWQFPLRHPSILLRRLTLKEDRTISKAFLYMIFGRRLSTSPPLLYEKTEAIRWLYDRVEPKCLSSNSKSGDIKVLGVAESRHELQTCWARLMNQEQSATLEKILIPPQRARGLIYQFQGSPLHCVFPPNKNILIEQQKLSKLKINHR